MMICLRATSKRFIPALFLITAHLAFSTHAAITFNNASSTGTGAGSVVSWSHAVGSGANRMLVVGVTTESNPDALATSVTFGTQNLTKVTGSRSVQGATSANATELWYLAAPRIGTGTITVNLSPSVTNGAACGAVSLFGVAQAAPEAVAAASYSGTGGAYSLQITTITDGAWLVDVVNSNIAAAFATATSGMTERWDLAGSTQTQAACATRSVSPPGTVTDDWTTSMANRRAQSIAAFAPAAPGPPETYISSPSAGSLVSIATYTVNAVAVDDGSVSNVAFYEDGNFLGNDATSPYSFTRLGAAPGAHSLTVVATDNLGNNTTSPGINVTATDLPPSVSLTAPSDGSQFVQGWNITLTATASDLETSVTKVEFFGGATLLFTDAVSPYQFTWVGAAVGSHAIKAVATDTLNATTNSAVSTITVQPPIAVAGTGSGTILFDTLAEANRWATLSVPGASLDVVSTGSVDNAMAAIAAFSVNRPLSSGSGSFTSGTAYWRSNDRKLATNPTGNKMTVLMAPLLNTSGATVDDLAVTYTLGLPTTSPGEIIKGRRVYWSKTGNAGSWNLAGEDELTTSGTTTEVSFYLTSLAWASGSNLYVVWVDDNGVNPDGDYTMDNVAFTPFTGPAVTITNPISGATMGADVRIEATAATSNGAVSSVKFYDGATLLATDVSAPYQIDWTGASAGGHALTAVALDSNSLSATSATVNVTVAAGSGTLTRGPYLQMPTPTTMTVRWRSTLSTRGRVAYGTTAGSLTESATEPRPPDWPFDHVVTLTGLVPNTTYFYSIGSEADVLASGTNYTFHTSPLPGSATNTRIWVVGDCGRGSSFQTAVRDAYYAWTGARTPDFCLMLGDNAYNSGTDSEYQSGFYNIYPTMFRKMPIWSTMGNHDAENGSSDPNGKFPYLEMFTFPTAGEAGGLCSGTERYYSFDYGNIHVINLDSMTSSRAVDNPATPLVNEDGPMAAWLRMDLASTTKTWIIVMFHHPPYSKGSHDSDVGGPGYDVQMGEMRTNFNPIFDAGGVDLVLLGHSHAYERSILVDGHYGLSSTLTAAMKKNAGSGRPSGDGAYIKPLSGPRDHYGAVYAVAGSAGSADGGALNHPVMYISYNTGGTLNLDIDGNRLDATYVEKGATTGTFTTPDTFTILKQDPTDADSDGIPDGYEDSHGLDRDNPADAGLDPDGDGSSNLKEYHFATSLTFPDVYSFSTSYNPFAVTASVTFNTVVGRSYRVFYSRDLISWLPCSASLTGSGTAMTWTDDGSTTCTPPSQENIRFYRIEARANP